MSDLFINSSFSAKEKPMQVRHLLTAWLLTAAGVVLLMGIVASMSSMAVLYEQP